MSTSTAHVTVGTALPPLDLRFTRETLARYAGASTDFNPIHYSDGAAAALGLPGVVAHGMLTLGSALRIVTAWVGDASLVRSWTSKFAKPVVVPDGVGPDDGARLAVTATVTALDPDARTATVTVEVECAGERVLRNAVAVVALPEGWTL